MLSAIRGLYCKFFKNVDKTPVVKKSVFNKLFKFTLILIEFCFRVMIKRAQGRKRFGRKNFKQRYFRLTTQDLTYSKTKGTVFKTLFIFIN